jgi:hypothetical protein
MQNLIIDLYEIIKDYRKNDKLMSHEHILKWIAQFGENDRSFILEQTIELMRKRYICEERGRQHVRSMINFLLKNANVSSAKEFINDAYFIDNQEEGKSQKFFLKFFDEILKTEYGTSLEEQNISSPKHIIYLDDILCTGETVIKSFCDPKTGWLNLKNESSGLSNREYCLKNKIDIDLAYLAIHDKCTSKLEQRFYRQMGNKKVPQLNFIRDDDFEIENNLENRASKFNFLFPSSNIKDDDIEKCRKQIQNKLRAGAEKKGRKSNHEISYRDPSKPDLEVLFSEEKIRDKYESIILKKCIEIYNSSPSLKHEIRPRPLGYGLYYDYSFGFGTIVFTWRNAPFNTPLIFWYPYYGWVPLFKRDFT